MTTYNLQIIEKCSECWGSGMDPRGSHTIDNMPMEMPPACEVCFGDGKVINTIENWDGIETLKKIRVLDVKRLQGPYAVAGGIQGKCSELAGNVLKEAGVEYIEKLLDIPDFLRNQENLADERKDKG